MRTENNEPAVLASVRAHGGYNYRYWTAHCTIIYCISTLESGISEQFLKYVDVMPKAVMQQILELVPMRAYADVIPDFSTFIQI